MNNKASKTLDAANNLLNAQYIDSAESSVKGIKEFVNDLIGKT